MKRLHVHVSVEKSNNAISFYSALFAAKPAVVKPDYAKWMLEDPRVNFAISMRGNAPGLDHLGIQVENGDELQEVYGATSAGCPPRFRAREPPAAMPSPKSHGLTIRPVSLGKPSSPAAIARCTATPLRNRAARHASRTPRLVLRAQRRPPLETFSNEAFYVRALLALLSRAHDCRAHAEAFAGGGGSRRRHRDHDAHSSASAQFRSSSKTTANQCSKAWKWSDMSISLGFRADRRGAASSCRMGKSDHAKGRSTDAAALFASRPSGVRQRCRARPLSAPQAQGAGRSCRAASKHASICR